MNSHSIMPSGLVKRLESFGFKSYNDTKNFKDNIQGISELLGFMDTQLERTMEDCFSI